MNSPVGHLNMQYMSATSEYLYCSTFQINTTLKCLFDEIRKPQEVFVKVFIVTNTHLYPAACVSASACVCVCVSLRLRVSASACVCCRVNRCASLSGRSRTPPPSSSGFLRRRGESTVTLCHLQPKTESSSS